MGLTSERPAGRSSLQERSPSNAIVWTERHRCKERTGRRSPQSGRWRCCVRFLLLLSLGGAFSQQRAWRSGPWGGQDLKRRAATHRTKDCYRLKARLQRRQRGGRKRQQGPGARPSQPCSSPARQLVEPPPPPKTFSSTSPPTSWGKNLGSGRKPSRRRRERRRTAEIGSFRPTEVGDSTRKGKGREGKAGGGEEGKKSTRRNMAGAERGRLVFCSLRCRSSRPVAPPPSSAGRA